MLLALVFGVVLVLIGVTASALVAVSSFHLKNATLESVVSRDAALVELFVNGSLRSTDLDAGGPGRSRADELNSLLASLSDRDGIVRVEIRDLDGRVLLSADEAGTGRVSGSSARMADARSGEASAIVVAPGDALAALGSRAGEGGRVPE